MHGNEQMCPAVKMTSDFFSRVIRKTNIQSSNHVFCILTYVDIPKRQSIDKINENSENDCHKENKKLQKFSFQIRIFQIS